MPSITITVSTEAHERLRRLKKPGQSFSDVILEHVYPPPLNTAGELLDYFQENPPPKGDSAAFEIIRANRGRRSSRPSSPRN